MALTPKQKELREKCRVLTPEFRLAFPSLFKATAMKGGVPKFSATMLFDKKKDLSVIKAAIKNAKIFKWGPNKDEWPECESPVTDGDSKPEYEGYKGHYAIKASTGEDQKPGVYEVGEDGEQIEVLEAGKIPPGSYCDAIVFARVWEFPVGSGRFGVQFILDHIRKRREGKTFGGKPSADKLFKPIEGGGAEESDEEDFT